MHQTFSETPETIVDESLVVGTCDKKPSLPLTVYYNARKDGVVKATYKIHPQACGMTLEAVAEKLSRFALCYDRYFMFEDSDKPLLQCRVRQIDPANAPEGESREKEPTLLIEAYLQPFDPETMKYVKHQMCSYIKDQLGIGSKDAYKPITR